ncbi:glycosyltransferase family 39 protein [Streptomyces sp. NPDC086787]|uniref:glycosyltransferase family 39 protein n=1 Tax=Streptomyces sp. NPDC086787 TaxID=3365759 RepID=UPI0037FEDDFA
MLALGLWGLDRGGMWRDEAVTVQVARRTVPQIWRLLHGIDAVHGLYYLLMHEVLALHPGEVVLRLPSVCGAAATAGLVAALGTRLVRPRVGLWAGLLYAVTPMAGHYAQEGRSYALVAAGATGATLLLVHAVDTGRAWRAYGVLLGVTCWLHEFAVLLLLAHAVTLAAARVPARVWRSWGFAAGAVVLALLPLVAVSHAQSAQLAWLTAPTVATAQRLLSSFAGTAPTVYWTCLALAGAGLVRRAGPRGKVTCTGVALPLAVLPPVVLMLASQFSPLYVDRYVLYALSGAPLLVAAGADRVVGALGRFRPWAGLRVGRPGSALLALAGVLAVALAFVHQLPLLRQDRLASHRPDDLAAVSRAAGRHLRPGDPVLFLPSSMRGTALAYPGAFRGTRDVALAVGAPESGTLYGVEAGPDALRRRLDRLDRVWVVAERRTLDLSRPAHDPTELAKLDVLGKRFVPGAQVVRHREVIRLYVRRTPATGTPATAAPASPPVSVPPSPGQR